MLMSIVGITHDTSLLLLLMTIRAEITWPLSFELSMAGSCALSHSRKITLYKVRGVGSGHQVFAACHLAYGRAAQQRGGAT